MKKLYSIHFILMVLISSGVGFGGTTGPDSQSQADSAAVTIAIMDFESKAPGNADLGKQIAEILSAKLSIYEQFRLVERQKLDDLLKEHQLSLTGAVDSGNAIKIGKLLGARIMIFGKAFPVDKDIYITAKIVGTETSLVKGAIAKGKLESNMSDVIDQLSDKLVQGLPQWTPELLPANEKVTDKIAFLKTQITDINLPRIAIIVSETHMSQRVPDPAAQTEIMKIFREIGFDVVDVNEKQYSGWIANFKKNSSKCDLPDLRNVDIFIKGEGFSEFGTRMYGLVSCTARLEVQAVQLKSKSILCSERTTRRAVDLSEMIAGKTALQAAGRELALKVVEQIIAKSKTK